MFLLDKSNHLPSFNGNVKMLLTCVANPYLYTLHGFFNWLCHLVLVVLFFEIFLDLSCFCYRIYNLIKLHFISNNLRCVSSLIELHCRNFKENDHETPSCVYQKGRTSSEWHPDILASLTGCLSNTML